MTPSDFADSLRAYCGWSRASVTSYVRSPERNKLVGGAVDSRHLIALAADVSYHPNVAPRLATAKRQALKLGMTLIREDDHDHLQAR
mgnify:CR=1 FL=1